MAIFGFIKETMIKYIAVITILFSCAVQPSKQDAIVSNHIQGDTLKNIYQFKVESLDGGIIDFSTFKGKKILIVNTASECGFTPQYKELEELYSKYHSTLVIVGFPTNNFGGQEPGSNEEIKTFCQKNYGVTFPMAAKISVKGSDTAPLYQYLTSKQQNGVLDAEIKWNFNKFLVDESGHLIAKFDSKVNPMSEELIKKL